MKYALAISFFILISAFPSEQDGTKSPQVKDVVDINGQNKTVPSSTDINGGGNHPMPPEPSPKPPTSSTTIPPTNTTLSPNSTTTTPTPTTSNTTSTTPSPTTPSTPPTTPNGTTPTTKFTTTTVKPNSTTASTVKPTVPSTTGAPPSPITVKPEPERRFDGPSFVGGIVLALGLVAIGFVAFKFYKARTELNYHTL